MLLNINNLGEGDDHIKHLTEQMLFSYSFKSILDFMTGSQLLNLQVMNKYVYNTLIPTYFMTSRERKNILSKMKIPEKVCRKAILLF